VVNVSQIATVDKKRMRDKAGRISGRALARVEDGIRLVLGL
jgi:mRNA-degrading endonuclease toxin of MazEF toxin-antitoxin module